MYHVSNFPTNKVKLLPLRNAISSRLNHVSKLGKTNYQRLNRHMGMEMCIKTVAKLHPIFDVKMLLYTPHG